MKAAAGAAIHALLFWVGAKNVGGARLDASARPRHLRAHLPGSPDRPIEEEP
jgi:hypothetical protein